MKNNDFIGEGYWISPSGDFIPVTEHLVALQREPQLFGIPVRQVRGANIKQLSDVAVDLIKSGWVRARYLSPQGYLFEISGLSHGNYELIEEFLIRSKAFIKENITIETVKPVKTYSGTVDKFFDRTMFKYYQKNPKRTKWRLS